MALSQLYLDDKLSVEKIKKLAYATYNPDEYDEMWSDLLPSFQMICVKWLVDELEQTQKTLKQLMDIVEAHEIESLDCDNRGEYYCDCLFDAIQQAKKALEEH